MIDLLHDIENAHSVLTLTTVLGRGSLQAPLPEGARHVSISTVN